MGAIRKTVTGSEFIAIKANTSLNSGDHVKFYIKPVTNCFIYLIYQNSQGNLLSLFPLQTGEKDIRDRCPKGCLMPEGKQWFQLDEHKGKERFILLSSLERLAQLETLITNCEAAGNGRKIELASQILAEINSLKDKNSRLKASAERPLSIIGQVRGLEKPEVASRINLADYAVEISADKFYSRTITIDHR